MTRALSHRAVLALIAGLAGLAGLAGCGGSNAATTTTTTTAQTATSTTSNTTAPTTSATNTTQAYGTTAAGPTGGPVPRGFDPVSFTAISDRQFWLMGSAPCSNPVCTSIVRTTDGGRHFVGIPAPVAPIASSGGPPGQGLLELRFADQLDGFAGGSAYPQALWETHDGGAHWRPGLGGVVAFTVSAGRVYALTGRCASGTCRNLALDVSGARLEQWHSTPLPATTTQVGIGITAHGASVWIWASPASVRAQAQMLFYSSDAGRTLARLSSPCVPGLGGDLEASSDSVLWAVCPTGMMAQAWRSADAGHHWRTLPVGQVQHSLALSNGARVAPAGDQVALITAGSLGPLERTTDGGGAFTTVGPSQPRQPGWEWIGFTDPLTGSALRPANTSAAGPQGLELLELWRSYDGGTHWSGPIRIGS